MNVMKYWLWVNDEEEERRFQERIRNPIKRWKLSPMDVESRKRWVDYSKAKDVMFAHTDRKKTPWNVVNADDKKRARLNLHPASAESNSLSGHEASRDRASSAPTRYRL